ncbi:MAG: helix-hairpin-helix domain-containing protein [Gilvibacter sp.]
MGVFNFIQKQLRFALQDRLGLLLVVITILGSWYVFFYNSAVKPSSLNVDANQIQRINQMLDSIDSIQTTKSRFKLYPFNPNFITDYKGYQLGMSLEQIDRLHDFRAQNKWINSTADFKRVTGVSDSLLAAIRIYFKFPEWVTQKRPANTYYSTKFRGPKTDLNTATATQLEAVYGIGPALSKRILTMRERMQGFSDTMQLRAVYGLSAAVRARLFERFELSNPQPIKKMKFARASASDLATIPGVSFDLGVKMVAFRRLRDSMVLPAQLLKIDGMSSQKLELITLYLQFN